MGGAAPIGEPQPIAAQVNIYDIVLGELRRGRNEVASGILQMVWVAKKCPKNLFSPSPCRTSVPFIACSKTPRLN